MSFYDPFRLVGFPQEICGVAQLDVCCRREIALLSYRGFPSDEVSEFDI